jgi:hypothetical protein
MCPTSQPEHTQGAHNFTPFGNRSPLSRWSPDGPNYLGGTGEVDRGCDRGGSIHNSIDEQAVVPRLAPVMRRGTVM